MRPCVVVIKQMQNNCKLLKHYRLICSGISIFEGHSSTFHLICNLASVFVSF